MRAREKELLFGHEEINEFKTSEESYDHIERLIVVDAEPFQENDLRDKIDDSYLQIHEENSQEDENRYIDMFEDFSDRDYHRNEMITEYSLDTIDDSLQSFNKNSPIFDDSYIEFDKYPPEIDCDDKIEINSSLIFYDYPPESEFKEIEMIEE